MHCTKTKIMVLLALFTLAACSGSIKAKDGDEEEDAAEDTTDISPDQGEDVLPDEGDDPVPDTAPDTSEDPQLDTAEDVSPDTGEDPAVDTAEDPVEDPGEDTLFDPEPDTMTDPDADVDADVDEIELPAGCVLPTIPTDGLYVYYCMESDDAAFMRFYREVEFHDGTPDIAYGEETGCRSTSASRDMLCNLPDWGSGADVRFIIQTPGVGTGWSCDGTSASNGEPYAWYYGALVTFSTPTPAGSRCRHTFTIP